MTMSKPCLYTGLLSERELIKCIRDEYNQGDLALLRGSRSKEAFDLLEHNPQVFVMLIALYLLTFVATRIKDERYHLEEETRVIIQTQRSEVIEFVKQNRVLINDVLRLNSDALIQTLQQEKIRQRGDMAIFYRECHLPISLLQAVYTRPEHQKRVEEVMRSLVQKKSPFLSLIHNNPVRCNCGRRRGMMDENGEEED